MKAKLLYIVYWSYYKETVKFRLRSTGEILCKLKNLLENESIYEKYQHFSCPKNPFFWKIEQILQEFSEFFRKIILKFSIFMIPYKSREISGEF